MADLNTQPDPNQLGAAGTTNPNTTPNATVQPVAANNVAPAVAPQTSTSAPDPATLASWYNQYAANSPAAPAAPTATASKADVTTWDPSKQATVQGQLTGLLATGSPLMTQAQTAADQQSNARGLLNSSLAVGSAQDAVIRSALPIATSDAATFARSQESNAAAANTAALQNAQLSTGVSQSNAGLQQQENLQTQDLTNQRAMQQTGLLSQKDLQTQSLNMNAQLQTTLQNSSQGVQQAMQQFQAASQAALQNASLAEQGQIAQLNANTQVQLTNLADANKLQLQTSQSAAATFQQLLSGIATVMSDPNMDAASKSAYVSNLIQTYNSGLQIQSQITGLNLGSILDNINEPISGGGATSSGSSGSGGSNAGGYTPAEGGEPGAGP